MTVTVTEDSGRCRAEVDVEGNDLPCCEAGHPSAEEAAAHAWRLTRAMARKAATGAAQAMEPGR